jgi:hypothetical protein
VTLTLIAFNPVDLARIIMLLQLDISALMGYTGAFTNSSLEVMPECYSQPPSFSSGSFALMGCQSDFFKEGP